MKRIKPGCMGYVKNRILVSDGVTLTPNQTFFVVAISSRQNGLIVEIDNKLLLIPNKNIDDLRFVWFKF